MIDVLYVAYRFPSPPDKGERIRAFHQIRHLHRHCRLHVVCPIEQQPTSDAVNLLIAHCDTLTLVPASSWPRQIRAAWSLARGGSAMAGIWNSAALRSAINDLTEQHRTTVVLASGIFVAESVRHLTGVRKILDMIDVYSEVWREDAERQPLPFRWLAELESYRLLRHEQSIVSNFDSVLVVSSAEAKTFQKLIVDRPVDVVGNGVDLDYFSPRTTETPPTKKDFVFTGTMDYPPNIDAVCYFAQNVFPMVLADCPEATFTIAGRDPVAAVRRLAINPAIRVTGAVADIRPILTNAIAAVIPIRYGQGIQNKVLEAMAMGIPVVCSSRALVGLDDPDPVAIRRCDCDQSFASEMLEFVHDHRWRTTSASAARRYVEQHHRWEDYGRTLLNIVTTT